MCLCQDTLDEFLEFQKESDLSGHERADDNDDDDDDDMGSG